jgi:hypothetical protein
MRMLNTTVSHQLMGDTYCYFVFFRGDHYLLNAKNDRDAIVEAESVLRTMVALCPA